MRGVRSCAASPQIDSLGPTWRRARCALQLQCVAATRPAHSRGDPRRGDVKRHADFLGLLYLAWGAIFALVGLAGLALMAGALAIGRAGGAVAASSDLAAGVTAFTFGVLAVL